MGYERLAQRAVESGLRFLLAQQAPDGFWRDFELRIGPSEGWTTAWIGSLVTRLPHQRLTRSHLRQARRAIVNSCGPSGWGYHRRAGADADSTAWALRFLAASGGVPSGSAERLLGPYIDVSGAAHTFVEPGAGAWATSHPDVTAVTGLALLEGRSSAGLVEGVRRAMINAHEPGAGWRPYWWQTCAYANARAIEFLSASGGTPPPIRESLIEWVGTNVPTSPLETAWMLDVTIALGCPFIGLNADLLAALLSTQAGDGGWPSSAHLLVPPRNDADANAVGPFADVRRSVTTAGAIAALGAWLMCRNRRPG